MEFLEGGHEGALALGPVDEERPLFHQWHLQAQRPLQVQLCRARDGGQNVSSPGTKWGLGQNPEGKGSCGTGGGVNVIQRL